MPQTSPSEAAKCEFCDKRGLPLLLVRDAIAPARGGAPAARDLPITLSPSAAHYTKRLLRSGYVNLYDESRQRWESYFVTCDSYMFKLNNNTPTVPIVPVKPFNCPNEGHQALASCITIPDPLNASSVWIAFSDVMWTDAVRKRHQDSSYRKRHMLEIDVKAAMAGNGTLPGASSISQVTALVAEYAMEPTMGRRLFGWSSAPFAARNAGASRLIQECNALRPGKGLIVTLPDPAGIAQELALLMRRNTDLFTDSKQNKRHLAASAAIAQIEMGIRVAAEKKIIADADLAANRAIEENGLAYAMSASFRETIERRRFVAKGEARLAADAAWSRYAEKFDNAARHAWDTSFQVRLKAFNDSYIAPLALAHASWMQCAAMTSHFECNYDTAHAESGLVYTNVITRCVAGTQDKGVCSQVYDEWLDGTPDDPKNLLLRAMLFNQHANIAAVVKASLVSLDLRQIPWDSLFATYTVALQRLSNGARDSAAQLLTQVAGPLARALGKVMDGSTRFRSLFMMTGLISGHPIVMVEVIGSRKAFRAQLIKTLLAASGQSISHGKMNHAVSAELHRLQVHGVPLAGTTKHSFIIPADSGLLKNVPPGLNEMQRADYLASTLRTIEQVEALNLNRWRQVISTDVRLGIVTGILQAICLTKSVDDQEKAMANEKFDADTRLLMGAAALMGTTAEVIGLAMVNRALLGMRFGQGLTFGAGAFLKAAGRIAGIAAALIVACLDFRKAYEAYREGQTGLAGLYVVSGLVGLGLTGALFSTFALPNIGLLIAFLIGIALIIEYVKDNPIQDWLERTPWGRLIDQRYPDLATEQEQLKQALT